MDTVMTVQERISSNSWNDITADSDNACGSWDCSHASYSCSDTSSETIYYSYLDTNEYLIRIEHPWTSATLYGEYRIEVLCFAAGTLAAEPTPTPTLSPTLYGPGQFPGSTLMSRGFNIFTAKLSGSPILDEDHVVNNTETYTTEISTCTYSSLQFSSWYSSFSSYAESDSKSIALGFSASGTGAGGSLSTVRTETRSNAQSSQSYIYSIDLKCTAAQASIVGFNHLHWNPYFIEALLLLPQSYSDGYDLEDYVEFWKVFGTHVLESVDFGGRVHGAVVADACSVEESFGESTSFDACLSGAYKGVEVEGCYGEGESSYDSQGVSSSIENTYIEVIGGDSSTYSTVFSAFGDKSTAFDAWIADLEYNPYVVGGNVDEIHDAITKAIALGDHNLNIVRPLDDDVWLAIASAMKAAFKAYAAQLEAQENVYQDDECHLSCDGFSVDSVIVYAPGVVPSWSVAG
eukprot:CAMPEP_0202694278 /NCGR_PEP_ID=MMETSP1385-20130828/8178_1 /ASSEMBLY_ACC=CAM_ASM_000861 /TAXON_ID=933848 /ORGANISM="Elphidium margaritaceum" /LENGTH=460 /DNA_ID=CAMNT_0049350093 /DNA_START=45 /DNA_END=1428 /DNA_ORIENTATION=-